MAKFKKKEEGMALRMLFAVYRLSFGQFFCCHLICDPHQAERKTICILLYADAKEIIRKQERERERTQHSLRWL
jgi:hypothetical protein